MVALIFFVRVSPVRFLFGAIYKTITLSRAVDVLPYDARLLGLACLVSSKVPRSALFNVCVCRPVYVRVGELNRINMFTLR